MELTQGMELAQVLKLSPGLLQSMEMLQMNTLELGAYLKELALENPVLEEAEPGQGQGQDTWEAFASQVPWLGDTPWTGQTAQEGDWGRGESPTESLAFLLEEQLARRGLSPELLAVCRYLAGLLDDDGRLDPEDLAGLRTAGVPAELLERGVEVLQSLEPAGVGARSLEECLLLQLRRLPGEHTVAQAICQGHLEELSKEHYGALARRLGVTQRQVEAAAREIRALSPSPVGEGVEPPAGFCQPVGFAPVSGEPDLPADAARRGGGGDRGLSASKAPAGPVGADVRAAAAEDAGGLRAGPGPGPGGLFPGLSGGAGAAAAPGGGGAAGGPSLHGDPGAEAQIPSVPSGTVSHGVLFCPAHGGGGGLPPAGEGRTGQDDPGGGPPAAAE